MAEKELTFTVEKGKTVLKLFTAISGVNGTDLVHSIGVVVNTNDLDIRWRPNFTSPSYIDSNSDWVIAYGKDSESTEDDSVHWLLSIGLGRTIGIMGSCSFKNNSGSTDCEVKWSIVTSPAPP